jgi:uncharacterized repeat protein (TIGR03803 family)
LLKEKNMDSQRRNGLKGFAPQMAWVFRLRLLAATLALVASRSDAQTIKGIYSFNVPGPINPQAVGVIAQGRDGNMWSTALDGGKYNIGAAFRITPKGHLTDVHDFNPGSNPPEGQPNSGLTLGTDGNFYGTMYTGGLNNDGALFKMTPGGVVTILHSFDGTDGTNPDAPPIEASDGSFWGTTKNGGSNGDGTIYSWTAKQGFVTQLVFGGSDGAHPIGPLMQATDGSFWGTTQTSTNLNGPFVVFRITSSGNFTYWVYQGAYDYSTAGLVQDPNGNFYGTAYASIGACGFVFEITQKGTFTDLYNLNCGSDGGSPYAGLLLATDGNFYGMANNDGTETFGTFYEIRTKGTFKELDDFNGANGEYPSVTPIQHTNGHVYGDASQGGLYGYGTFYEVTGLKFENTPFVKLVPPAGKVGESIGILGQGFTGTTRVSFNVTPVKFKVVSDTYMTAQVPSGATTGFVTVTEGKSQLKSNTKFQVIKSGMEHGLVAIPKADALTSASTRKPPFKRAAGTFTLSPTSGYPDSIVTLTSLYYNIEGATNVTFNGVPASFQVVSNYVIKAAVPADAPLGNDVVYIYDPQVPFGYLIGTTDFDVQ